MHAHLNSGPIDATTPRPLAELLDCPAPVESLLNSSAQHLKFADGDTVFRQADDCEGLYLVISGLFQRRAERLESRLVLGDIRAGNLVELAAALGASRHTYTLVTITSGSMLFLPIDGLNRAFEAYPPLRMKLLQELAREVSRAYDVCTLTRLSSFRTRRVAPFAE